jgi:hypothetical protein
MDKETTHAKRKRLGVCSICGKAPRPSKGIACAECKAKRNRDQKVIRAQRKLQGLCVVCGQGYPEPKKTLCLSCLERARRRTQEIKKKGQCYRCAKPNTNGKKLCDTCLSEKKSHNSKYKKMVIEAYGGRCVCCGEDNPIFLSMDHIDNDGNKHRAEGVGCGNKFYQWLIRNNFPKDNYQLLCFNCNLGKRINGGVCPHQQETGGIRGCGNGHLRLVSN